MKEDKILTIVIPTYNMEMYLNRCLDSLLIGHALLDKLEVIIVNDGSKDRSLEIAQEYEIKYTNSFRVIDKENGNYGSCVNKGLSEARGKFFRLLDADDWFNSEELATFIIELEKCDSDVVTTNYSLQYSDNRTIINSMTSLEYNKKYNINELDIVSRNSHLLCMHALTYKLDFLRRVSLRHQEGISYTDIEYCYFPLSIAQSIIYIDVNLYQYFIGREGQTISNESFLKRSGDLYKVCIRVINDYNIIESDLNKVKKLCLLHIIMYPLYRYYLVNIIYGKPSCDFLSLDKLVQKNSTINNKILSVKFKKVKFVYLWRVLNIRCSILRWF